MISKMIGEFAIAQIRIGLASYKLGLAFLQLWSPAWWQEADRKRFEEDMVNGVSDPKESWNKFVN